VTSFEGVEVGRTGYWVTPRRYRIPASLVRKDAPSLVCVRVRDHGFEGGLVRGVRLRPDPEAILERIEGGGLLGLGELTPPPRAAAPSVR